MTTLSKRRAKGFSGFIQRYYRNFGRQLPWRQTTDPYAIMVSEIMLQQTQVDRVIPKYQQFLGAFPKLTILAEATLAAVLRLWSGLGYNRRAKMLWQAASKMKNDYGGEVPSTILELQSLPGIGKYSAAAIMAFAFNQPVVVIETNIRAVYLYHFADVLKVGDSVSTVDDAVLVPLIEATMDKACPRDFYNGLMDYGAYLKSVMVNPTRSSSTYAKQSPFAGSDRQLRGKVLKLLIKQKRIEQAALVEMINEDAKRVIHILHTMADEGLILKQGNGYGLGSSLK